MTPSPHAALIARLKSLHNDTDHWLCADVSEVDVAIRLIARCHDAVTDMLAALGDAPVPPTHDYFAHAPHAVVDAPVPPVTEQWKCEECGEVFGYYPMAHTHSSVNASRTSGEVHTARISRVAVPPATAGETRPIVEASNVIGGPFAHPGMSWAEASALSAPAPQDETQLVKDLRLAAAQLRHAYSQIAHGTVKAWPQFNDGLIAPQVERIERAADTLAILSTSPPPLICHWCKHPESVHTMGDDGCRVMNCPCVRFVLPKPVAVPPATAGETAAKVQAAERALAASVLPIRDPWVDGFDCNADVPFNVHHELMQAAIHKQVSLYWLCAIYRAGRESALPAPASQGEPT